MLQSSQYPTNGIRKTSNQFVLANAVLLVNLYENGMIIPVADNTQFFVLR